MTVTTVFFDYGGTLVHYPRAPPQGIPGAYRQALEAQGVTRTAAEVAQALEACDAYLQVDYFAHAGRSAAFWPIYDAQLLSLLDVEDANGDLARRLRLGVEEVYQGELYPETVPTLEVLHRQGLRLGVISNHNDQLLRLLARLDLLRHFATVTYSQEAGANKPGARVFEMALGKAGCRPDEAVHVGDSWEQDVLGARAVGIRPLWLDRTGGKDREGVRALRTLAEVPSHVGPGTARR